MKKNEKKITKKSLNVTTFLEKYYAVVNDNLRDDILTHKDIQYLFPWLKSLNPEFVEENLELYYTGRIVYVKDATGNCLPYIVSREFEHDNIVLDDREFLICELVSAIKKIISNSENGLIVLENSDTIETNLIGKNDKNIKMIDDEIVKLNRLGCILLEDLETISTFKYLTCNDFNYNDVNSLKNNEKILELSIKKDIISINILNNGNVQVIYDGEIRENLDMLQLRNFLLKFYVPREKEELVYMEEEEHIELYYLKDYEIVRLMRKFCKERNFRMYHLLKDELKKRKKEYEYDNKKWINNKIMVKKYGEEEYNVKYKYKG